MKPALILVSITVSSCSLASAYETCGEGKCFNGAECALEYRPNGDTFHFCKCDRESIEIGQDVYAGEFCLERSTKFCPAPEGHNPIEYFCTNNGECPENPHEHCKCNDNHHGPRCEFTVNKDDIECTLSCVNGGKCFFGDEPKQGSIQLPFGGTPAIDNMHCKCPEGFTGEFCDVKVAKCGDGEHMCLNGSECVPYNDEYTCDCAAANSDAIQFEGIMCEFQATVLCEGPFAGKHSFCTNQGVCRGQVTEKGHPGCHCSKGFTGDYCEFVAPNSRRTNGIAGKIVLGFSLTLLGLVVIFGGVFFVKTRRNERERMVGAMNTENPKFVPPEVKLYAIDLDSPDNTMDMNMSGLEYGDEEDDDDLSFDASLAGRENEPKQDVI
jgi:hypothetical protein